MTYQTSPILSISSHSLHFKIALSKYSESKAHDDFNDKANELFDGAVAKETALADF